MDILGHNDPTMLKALMDIVKENPKNYPFKTVKEIPIADEKIFDLLREDANGKIDSLGISEFGTNFVTNMLREIKINNFSDLVKVSGLSHGTDVWANNNEELMSGNTEFGKIDFKDTIGCRDDIMVQMIAHNIDNKTSFDIMEFVRKGKVQGNPEKWEEYKAIMKEHNVPDWYIWSCERIKYMFPKAHAVAYVMSALRIAWFKAYRPLDFYQAIFSVRAEQFDAEVISSNDVELIKAKIEEIRKGDMTKNDKDTIHFMEMAIEMILKGYRFNAPLPNKSDAKKFTKLNETTLLMPFSAIKGVGETKAIQLFENRTTPYTDVEDFKNRGGANKKIIEALENMNNLIF
jgi:DNA polymerase-3 subunit alpha (Gram-positive type)